MHHIECEVKASDEEPEVEFAEPLAQLPASKFRVPVIKCGEERKQDSTDDYVVKVRHHKVRVAELPVKRRTGKHDSREAGYQKLEKESDGEKHRHLELNPSTP